MQQFWRVKNLAPAGNVSARDMHVMRMRRTHVHKVASCLIFENGGQEEEQIRGGRSESAGPAGVERQQRTEEGYIFNLSKETSEAVLCETVRRDV